MTKSIPKKMAKKLDREVHYRCPIPKCGSFPLVRAHTIKKLPEVGYNYDYMLSICGKCEEAVEEEDGTLTREYLHQIKQIVKKSISRDEMTRPYNIPNPIGHRNYIGNNLLESTDTLIKTSSGLPLLWIEEIDGIRTLNARFFMSNGQLISAIDKNMWTADRNRFFDFNIDNLEDSMVIEIVGRSDDTKIKIQCIGDEIHFLDSIMYSQTNRVEIDENGDLIIGGATISNCTFVNCGAAFSI